MDGTNQPTDVAEEQEGRSLDELAGEGQVATPVTEEQIMKPVDFKEGCFGMRGDIELVKSKCKNWLSRPELLAEPFDAKVPMNKRQEMAANMTLAYRHLEDARMRIGKAVQAYDGGKSCYPR